MKKLLVLLAAVPLSACISFAAKPPPSLLTLHSDAALTPGQTQNSANAPSITVLVPVVSQALATQRVPVQATDTSIAYIVNAQWAEPPARLFARLLSDTISAKTGHVVLSTAESFTDPGARLTGELRNFGIDAASHSALVTYDAALIRTSGGGVEKRRFEARVPVSAVDADNAGTGISQAANQVADQVADWIGH
jgi:cholesterol transport system auxiliary component